MNVIDALSQRSLRERFLLLLLVVIVLPLALVFGAALPLQEHRKTAQADLNEAQALNDWVASRASEAAHLAPISTQSEAPVQNAPIGLSGLEQSLLAANLRRAVDRLEARGSGDIALEFGAVDFVDLMQWIDAQDPEWGYVITSVRIEPGKAPALVKAAFLLGQAGL